MRKIRLFAALLTAATLAVPHPAQAINTLAYSWVVDCANPSGASTGSLGITLPSGIYLVAVEGACTYGTQTTHTYNVRACLPNGANPCVNTGANVTGVPGATCIVGVSGVYHQTCDPNGVWLPGCGWWFTVQVNNQCLSVQHTSGLISHGGGAMTARVLDGRYDDNVGQFVVTATWTPL